MGWACGAYGWGAGVYRVLVGIPEGRRPLRRPRRRWVDNIRMDLQKVGCGYMDWIGLAQDRDRWWTLVSAVMNLRVPWNAGNFLSSCKEVSFSRRILHNWVSKWVVSIGGPRQHSGYGAVLQIGRSLVQFQLVSVEFFIDIKSFRSHYDPGVNSASNRNEYQEHFLGVKAAGA